MLPKIIFFTFLRMKGIMDYKKNRKIELSKGGKKQRKKIYIKQDEEKERRKEGSKGKRERPERSREGCIKQERTMGQEKMEENREVK